MESVPGGLIIEEGKTDYSTKNSSVGYVILTLRRFVTIARLLHLIPPHTRAFRQDNAPVLVYLICHVSAEEESSQISGFFH